MSYEVPAIIVLTAFAVFPIMWIYLIVRGFRGKWPGSLFASLAAQVSLVLFLIEAPHGGENAIFAALIPPSVLIFVPRYLGFAEFLAPTLYWVVPIGMAALTASLVVPALRRYTIAIVGLSMFAAFLPAGEAISAAAMCRSALEHGVSVITRNSFWWSVGNAPRDFQWEIHAKFVQDGQVFGWSYREMDWYAVPKDASDDVEGEDVACSPHT